MLERPDGQVLFLPRQKRCPITLESFRQARTNRVRNGLPFLVAAVAGSRHTHFFEAAALDRWMEKNGQLNPLTQEPILADQLIYFGALREGSPIKYLGSINDLGDRTRRGLFLNLVFMANRGSPAARLCLDTVVSVGDNILDIMPHAGPKSGSRKISPPPSIADAQQAALLAVRGGHVEALYRLAQRFPVAADADFWRMAILHSRIQLVHWAIGVGASLEDYIANSSSLGVDTDFHREPDPASFDVRPLSYAAHLGDEKMVEALLERGAVVDARDRQGHTAQYHAKNHPNVRRCLEEFGHQVGESPAAAGNRAPSLSPRGREGTKAHERSKSRPSSAGARGLAHGRHSPLQTPEPSPRGDTSGSADQRRHNDRPTPRSAADRGGQSAARRLPRPPGI